MTERSSRILAIVGLAVFAAVAGDASAESALAELRGGFGEWLEGWVERLRDAPPVLFFGAFVVATLLPVPIGLFYLMAGAIYGVTPALLWTAGALVVSNLIIHTASRSFLRPTLEALVTRRGHTVPRFASGLDEALFITLVRITPGLPYFLQNLILAVARPDLMRFLVLSVAIQMIYVTGFVVLGRSALEGELGYAVAAIAGIVALTAGARIFASRRAMRDEGDPS